MPDQEAGKAYEESVAGMDPARLPAKLIVPALVRLIVLPGATLVATPPVRGVIVPPVVTVPTVPVPETVTWLLRVRLEGSVMAVFAWRLTEAVPEAPTCIGTA